MKKTVSLMLAFLLSMTVFVSDVIGLTMVARAEEIVSDESVPSDVADPGDPGDPGARRDGHCADRSDGHWAARWDDRFHS